MATPAPVRVAVLADLLEEGWTSMDLVADVLMRELPRLRRAPVLPVLVRPPLIPVLGHAPLPSRLTSTRDRVINRFWLYRRALRQAVTACDVFHVVDHSYAHLALELPPGRTVVTCHDADTFRGVLVPGRRESGLPAFLVRRLGRGLRAAQLVACDSRATANEIVGAGLVSPERIAVIPNGVERRAPSAGADTHAARLLSTGNATVDVLHVGSTIPRKRIDLVIDTLARLAEIEPRVRLIRVGGPLTGEHRARAVRLGVHERILELPFLAREVLLALYDRVRALLLTSDREGFGLPLVEALEAGVPCIVRDLPVLREVGEEAATYVAGDDAAAWADAVARVLREPDLDPAAAEERRRRATAQAARFCWTRYASELAAAYERIAARAAQARALEKVE